MFKSILNLDEIFAFESVPCSADVVLYLERDADGDFYIRDFKFDISVYGIDGNYCKPEYYGFTMGDVRCVLTDYIANYINQNNQKLIERAETEYQESLPDMEEAAGEYYKE